VSVSARITAVETVRPRVQPNLLFVLLHDVDGRTGLGEAFFGARAVESYLHETAAPALFALADPTPERAAAHLASYLGFQGGGVETRGNGAVDLALWDLLGQRAGLPLTRLLGGPCRDEIRVYNTCAGPGYVRDTTRQESANWGVAPGELEDLDAFLHRPGELAAELRTEGFTGMKVWPFDRAAERTNGHDIDRAELRDGLAVLTAIRESVGDELDLMVELHGLWDLRCATRLLRELARFDPLWVEDPIRPDAVGALARLAGDTAVPIATGETVTGRRGFAALLDAGVPSVATVDVQWTGGLTEARAVAALADVHGVPIAPHDCTGPVTFAAAVHLVCAVRNGLIQETVRAFLRTWYAELVTGLPMVADGMVTPGSAPGHGVALRADYRDVAEVTVSSR